MRKRETLIEVNASRIKINDGLERLTEFIAKYPFKSDPESIDELTADVLYKVGGDYFFKEIKHTLRYLGGITVGSEQPWKNACNQLEDFKDLLRIAVSDRPLAEKVDAPWDMISGMGSDRLIAKKIIACYDDDVLPIFKTLNLEHFHNELIWRLQLPSNYEAMSLGENFAYLTQTLLAVKARTPETNA